MEEREMELSQEMREKLKNVVGFSVKSEFPYVPKDYRFVVDKDSKEKKPADIPKAYWCVWTLKSKDGYELAKVEDSLGKMSYDDETKKLEQDLRSGSIRLETLEAGIVSVKKWIQEDGAVWSWDKAKGKLVIEKNGETEEKAAVPVKFIIKAMKIKLQRELQDAINERSQMTEEELKGLEL